MVFAVKPRDYSQKVNKKVRRLAMKCALSSKVAEQKLVVVDAMDITPKTQDLNRTLQALGIQGKALIVTETVNENLRRASANLQGIKPSLVNILNVYDILTHDAFVITRQAAELVEEVYA
jgi:large subunit ribosomal protein L4